MNEAKYKEFINNMITAKCSKNYCLKQGVFDNFYNPFLNYIEKKNRELLENIKNKSKFYIDEELIINSIICSTKEGLIEISLKTLITEFYDKKNKGQLLGDTSKTRYDLYDESFKKFSNIKDILNKYEVLGYLIFQRITSMCNLIEEAVNNLCVDIEEIRDRFSNKLDILESITLKSGDTHNGGKSVMIFNFDKGEKLVYKPHSLYPDEGLNGIYNYLNSKNTLLTEIHNVKVISKKEYGWQKFVEREECANERDAEVYFYKIGVILALLNVLKTGDIHSENIIAAKDNPVLIDLETLITNDNTEGLSDSLLLSYFTEINNSVLGSYLLPQNLEYSTIDIDLSGLSGKEGRKSEKITYLKLVDVGTDNIRFEKDFIVSTKNNNMITINGESLDILKYNNNIEQGFMETYELILKNKNEFIEILNKYLSKGVYRQVLRPTHIYSKYLQASYHPKYLRSFEDRKKLFSLLYECESRMFNNNEIKLLKTNYEVESLMCDDIPYFGSDYSSKSLYVNNEKVIDNYFRTITKDIVISRVKTMNSIEMRKQISYIRNSLITTKKDVFYNDFEEGEKVIGIDKNEIRKSLRSIGDYIYKRAIFNLEGTACTFPHLNNHGERVLIGPINYSLYDGSGLVLFLYLLGIELKENKYIELAEATLNGLEELNLNNNNVTMPASVFSGIGSLIYLYYNLSQMSGKAEYYEKYVTYLNRLKIYEISDEESIDIIGGAAGIIVLTINLYNETQDESALYIADKYSKYLYSRLVEEKEGECLSGFSHGYSGFALALLMAGTVLGNEKYYTLAIELISREDLLYREDIKNWIDLRNNNKEALNYWCHGAPGILLARVKMMKYMRKEDIKLVKSKVTEALEQFIQNGFDRSSNHSLCHGIMGNIDILKTISETINDIELIETCKSLFKDFLEYIEYDGFKYGLYGTLGMVSFMTGISGIGYGILRQLNPKLPSVLAIDLLSKGGIAS